MSDQAQIETAKAAVRAYNNKDWEAVKAAVTPGFVYEEIASGRRAEGVNATLDIWRGWAAALPDSAATFERALVSGNTVVIEATWRGTHTGTLQTPEGALPATGRKIELAACQVIELEGDKVKAMRHYFDMATLLKQLGVAQTASAQRFAGA